MRPNNTDSIIQILLILKFEHLFHTLLIGPKLIEDLLKSYVYCFALFAHIFTFLYLIYSLSVFHLLCNITIFCFVFVIASCTLCSPELCKYEFVISNGRMLYVKVYVLKNVNTFSHFFSVEIFFCLAQL